MPKPICLDEHNPTLAEQRALRRWAADQNWHDLGLEGLGVIPDALVPLQNQWINCEITDAEFRLGVLGLIRDRAPAWQPAPGSVFLLPQ